MTALLPRQPGRRQLVRGRGSWSASREAAHAGCTAEQHLSVQGIRLVSYSRFFSPSSPFDAATSLTAPAIDVTGAVCFSCLRSGAAFGAGVQRSGLSSRPLADVLARLGSGRAGLHGSLERQGLKILARLLHLPLPVAFGFGGDANRCSSPIRISTGLRFCKRSRWYAGRLMLISEAEFGDGVGGTLERAARGRLLQCFGGGHAAPPFLGGGGPLKTQMGASRRRRTIPAPSEDSHYSVPGLRAVELLLYGGLTRSSRTWPTSRAAEAIEERTSICPSLATASEVMAARCVCPDSYF